MAGDLLIEVVDDKELWDRFVAQQSGATFFHFHDWLALLAEHGGYTALFLGAFLDQKLVAVLPLALLKTRLSCVASSVPIYNAGGPLMDADLDAPVRQTVITALLKEVEQRLADQNVLRFTLATNNLQLCSGQLHEALAGQHYTSQTGDGFLLQLQSRRVEEVRQNYHAGFRDGLRQAKKRGARVIDGQDRAQEIYAIYAETMRHAGKPLGYDYHLVKAILASPCCLTRLSIVDERPIAFACALGSSGRYVYWLAGMSREQSEFRPMHLLMDELIGWLCERQAYSFDLGGGGTAGMAHFKASLGAQEYEARTFNKTFRPSLDKRLSQAQFWLDKMTCLTRRFTGWPTSDFRLQKYI